MQSSQNGTKTDISEKIIQICSLWRFLYRSIIWENIYVQFSVGSRQSLCFPVLIHKHGSALNRPIVTQRAKVVLGEATSLKHSCLCKKILCTADFSTNKRLIYVILLFVFVVCCCLLLFSSYPCLPCSCLHYSYLGDYSCAFLSFHFLLMVTILLFHILPFPYCLIFPHPSSWTTTLRSSHCSACGFLYVCVVRV